MKFLAAAALLATTMTPVQEGTYWQVETLFTMKHPRQVGSGYWVRERRSHSEWWTKDGKSWAGYRPQGTKPASKADEAKWRADGSPTSWTYRTEGMKVSLSTEPGKGWLHPAKGRPGFSWNEHLVTYQELQQLPTDVAALKATLNADFLAWAKQAAEEAKTTSPGSKLEDWTSRQDYYLAETLGRLLYQWPVTAKTRTAAYQALKSTTGVKVLGAAKDALGRAGERFAMPAYTAKTTVLNQQFIVDTKTMTMLSWAVDTKVNGRPLPAKTNETLYTKVGWTDQKPAVPAAD